MTNVWKIVSQGDSIYRILRGLEAPGGPGSDSLKGPGGPPKQNKPFWDRTTEAGSFGRLEVPNVLWPSEAPSVVFYEVWRPQEVQPLTKL